jgi:hypothetical protein
MGILYLFSMKLMYLLVAAAFMSCTPLKREIVEVYFEAEGCYGECPIFNMRIHADGKAEYKAKMFNKKQGTFKTVIPKPQLDTLTGLIQTANVFGLNTHYTETVSDEATYILSVTTKDGKVKTIRDYGHNGPKKLLLVYRYIFSLRESQYWK